MEYERVKKERVVLPKVKDRKTQELYSSSSRLVEHKFRKQFLLREPDFVWLQSKQTQQLVYLW